MVNGKLIEASLTGKGGLNKPRVSTHEMPMTLEARDGELG